MTRSRESTRAPTRKRARGAMEKTSGRRGSPQMGALRLSSSRSPVLGPLGPIFLGGKQDAQTKTNSAIWTVRSDCPWADEHVAASLVESVAGSLREVYIEEEGAAHSRMPAKRGGPDAAR